MTRKKKIKVITKAIADNSFGTPMSKDEYRWLAEHIVDALERAKEDNSGEQA